MEVGSFSYLTPQVVLEAVESAYALRLDGTLQPYNSYVNRVYGLRTDEGEPLVVKFYRPGRWSPAAVEQEHDFVLECAAEEIPVVAPVADEDGITVQEVTVSAGDREQSYLFALYPRKGGRNFDPETDEDWMRLGGIVGRVHQVALRSGADRRLSCHPLETTRTHVDELLEAGLVHPDVEEDFRAVSDMTIQAIAPKFSGVRFQRLHGDCHRGNILDRGDEGLLIIDFDDMMMGPAVQDLWLLLPERVESSRRELNLLLEQYDSFCDFDYRTIELVEPLRFMRMIYYLAWQARQRNDLRFRDENSGWGTRAFWITEIEDLREQARHIGTAVD